MSAYQSRKASHQASFAITLLAATFLLGSSFIAGKILLQDGFPPFVLVGWRFFVAALATLPFVYFDEGSVLKALLPARLGLGDMTIIVLIGLLQTAAVMGLLFLAMESISASTAAILLFTNPLWVAVLGRVFLGETLHRARCFGFCLGIVGVVLAIGVNPHLIASGSFANGSLAGEAIGLASAFCWSAATIVNKRANPPLSSWALSFWQMFIGSMAILAIAYAKGEVWPPSTTPAQWGWFFWLSIPASTGSFGLWFVALRKGGATKASGFLFLAPLFTIILSFFVLDATLSWLQALGGALIGVALWLINREIPARNSGERLREVLSEGEP